MSDMGWIKLHRKILDCWIWQEKPYDKARAWVDLLLLAMHHDKKMLIDNEVVCVNRGSYMTSVLKLSDRWGWSRNKVNRFLDVLESERMVYTKKTPKGTLITIVKYEDYQLSDFKHDTTNDTTDESWVETTGETPNETTDDTQNKNIKNNKNVKKERISEEYFPNDPLLNDAFKEFVSMRKKLKKPLATKQSITRMMNRLQKLSSGDNDIAIRILNQSTDKCWTDIYELKDNRSYRNNDSVDWSKV